MRTFKEVWAEKEREGYQYGEDALEGVRFGWKLAEKEYNAALERQMLEKGRHQARCAVFMQAMASLARNGMQEKALAWIAAADKAAADVRIEDFVVARVGTKSR